MQVEVGTPSGSEVGRITTYVGNVGPTGSDAVCRQRRVPSIDATLMVVNGLLLMCETRKVAAAVATPA